MIPVSVAVPFPLTEWNWTKYSNDGFKNIALLLRMCTRNLSATLTIYSTVTIKIRINDASVHCCLPSSGWGTWSRLPMPFSYRKRDRKERRSRSPPASSWSWGRVRMRGSPGSDWRSIFIFLNQVLCIRKHKCSDIKQGEVRLLDPKQSDSSKATTLPAGTSGGSYALPLQPLGCLPTRIPLGRWSRRRVCTRTCVRPSWSTYNNSNEPSGMIFVLLNQHHRLNVRKNVDYINS